MRKIYCEEAQKKGFDKLPIEKLKNMVGWMEPTKNGRVWEVNMLPDKTGYTANSQFEAQIISSLEEIKALLLKRK